MTFHPHNANQFAVTAGSEKVDPDVVLQVCDGQITRRQKCFDVIVEGDRFHASSLINNNPGYLISPLKKAAFMPP